MQDGGEWAYFGEGPFTREQITKSLHASRDRVVTFFEADDGSTMGRMFELIPEKNEGDGRWIGRNRILYLIDHEVHHRGKIALALRDWGMNNLPFIP